ncbi:MAG: NAD(P)H-hydrate dehydratase [Clostridiales bacterium]|nr:NAD(P)H-hydrate dehydratase [Clostridiales bacterium]
MQITITPDEMKTLEQSYMKEYAVPGALLMEHAAQGICAALRAHTSGGRALFLCGPGNNGGDGYAAARLWLRQGGQAVVMELTSTLSGDAAMNRTLAIQAGVRIMPASLPLPCCDVIVDALFGTGLTRDVEGLAADLIRAANESTLPIIAVDIPSGLHGGTGRILGNAIRAVRTVTFHRIKPGLLLHEGPEHAGRITIAPILIPRDYGTRNGLRCMEPEDIPTLIRPRPATSHKGTFGRVVIFAGSEGMAGAAAFAANAAIRSGAGLTTVLCRRNIIPVVQALAPGAVCLSKEDADIGHLLDTADAAVVGCGLGLSPDARPVLENFRHASCPVVWDADALNLIAPYPRMLALPENAVITPHPGEGARLLGCSVSQVTADPLQSLQALREKCGCHVLLKGARTLMTDGARTAVNRHGSPALAKGGSGDILSGMLGALLARRLPCTQLETMQLAALLHGLAGIRAAEKHGENCASPTDIIDCIRLD